MPNRIYRTTPSTTPLLPPSTYGFRSFPGKRRATSLRRVKKSFCLKARAIFKIRLRADDYGSYENGVDSSGDEDDLQVLDPQPLSSESLLAPPEDALGPPFNANQLEVPQQQYPGRPTTTALRKNAKGRIVRDRPRMSWLRPAALPPVTLTPLRDGSDGTSQDHLLTTTPGLYGPLNLQSTHNVMSTGHHAAVSPIWGAADAMTQDDEARILNELVDELSVSTSDSFAPPDIPVRSALRDTPVNVPQQGQPLIIPRKRRGKKHEESEDVDEYDTPVLRSISFKQHDGEEDVARCDERYARVLGRMIEPWDDRFALFDVDGPRMKFDYPCDIGIYDKEEESELQSKRIVTR